VIAPEWVAVSGFGRRRSLSDLTVWGFPETFPENLPPQALLSPFSPLFLPLNLLLQFLHPSNTSLHLSRSGLIALSTLLTLFFLPRHSPFLLQPFLRPLLDPIRTPSESLDRSFKRSQKAQNSPF